MRPPVSAWHDSATTRRCCRRSRRIFWFLSPPMRWLEAGCCARLQSRTAVGRPFRHAGCTGAGEAANCSARPDFRVLRLMTSMTMLDVTLLGGLRSGPFFACLSRDEQLTARPMRILYSAIDQAVPAPHGGSVHVTSVAEGLERSRARGARAGVARSMRGPFPPSGVVWWPMSPPLGDRRLAAASRPRRDSPRTRAATRHHYRALLQLRWGRPACCAGDRRGRRARGERACH